MHQSTVVYGSPRNISGVIRNTLSVDDGNNLEGGIMEMVYICMYRTGVREVL